LKLEVRSQKSEVRSQKSECGSDGWVQQIMWFGRILHFMISVLL